MSAEIKQVNAAGMPAPVAPYSNAVRAKASEFLFIAGQVALDASGNVVGVGDLEAQEVRLSGCRTVVDVSGAGASAECERYLRAIPRGARAPAPQTGKCSFVLSKSGSSWIIARVACR